MKGKKFKNYFFRMIQCALFVAVVCSLTGCNGMKENPELPSHQEISDTLVIGEGDIVFDFEIVDFEGNEKKYEVHTDDSNLGAALLELELIKGEKKSIWLICERSGWCSS